MAIVAQNKGLSHLTHLRPTVALLSFSFGTVHSYTLELPACSPHELLLALIDTQTYGQAAHMLIAQPLTFYSLGKALYTHIYCSTPPNLLLL